MSSNPGSGAIYASLSQPRAAALRASSGIEQRPPSGTSLEPARGDFCSLVVRDFWSLVAVIRSPINVLLVLLPFALASDPLGWNCATVFILNWLSIIPLAGIIAQAIEALCEHPHVGNKVGALVNAFFGKLVEMVMCVQCIRAGLIQVLQGNLMGSLHWNLLLVLGMCITVCGLQQKQAVFNADAAAAQVSCQVLASISIALPTMYRNVVGSTFIDALLLSRICAFFIMMVYFAFLLFHLKTHAEIFESDDAAQQKAHNNPIHVEGQLSILASVGLLLVTFVFSTFCSENVVARIEDISSTYNIPKAFIGCTLLPIIGNIAEHVTAIYMARMDLLDLAISIAVGSATQIALFVVPMAVLWGWLFDNPMTLDFRNFDATVMMLSTMLCAQVLQHGSSNWLHGAMLMITYVLIAIISWFIPE